MKQQPPTTTSAIENFVLIKILGKKCIKYLMAKVTNISEDGDFEVSYLKTSDRENNLRSHF